MEEELKLPNETDVAKALNYLAETDAVCAKEIAHVKALDFQLKTIKALQYLDADGVSIAEKNAQVDSSEVVRAWIGDYENAVAQMETVRARRKRAELTIDVWRSVNANRRQGGQ